MSLIWLHLLAFDLSSPSRFRFYLPEQSNSEICSLWEAGTFHFPERKARLHSNYTGISRGLKPDWNPHFATRLQFGGRSRHVRGHKGVIITDARWWFSSIFPESLRPIFINHPWNGILRSKGHHRDWRRCHQNGGQFQCQSWLWKVGLTELTLLGECLLRWIGLGYSGMAKNIEGQMDYRKQNHSLRSHQWRMDISTIMLNRDRSLLLNYNCGNGLRL